MYLRHLVDLARKALGPDALLFTTDPPQVTEIGSLRGEEVLTCAAHPGCNVGGFYPEFCNLELGGISVLEMFSWEVQAASVAAHCMASKAKPCSRQKPRLNSLLVACP